MDAAGAPAPSASATTPRTTLKRHADRAAYDRATIDAILDEAFVCHAAVAVDGSPRVLPTAFVRVGSDLYLHGARANRLLGAMAAGAPVCVTVTLIDGFVFARSAFHHSMNFRSVVVFGAAVEVTDPDEKRAALEALVDHMAPGRSREVKRPDDAELRSTLVVRLPILEASAKIRRGPPLDGPELAGETAWAGELPLRTRALPAVADPALREGVSISPSVEAVTRRLGGGGAPWTTPAR